MRVAIVVVAFLSITCSAFSVTDSVSVDSSVVVSDTVRVTAGLSVLTPALTPFSTHVVSQQDLKLQPVRATSDALQYVPGVDLRQRGALGVQADVSIRGGTFEQTAVMLDGVRLNDVQTGHHTMTIPFLPSDVDRIEVLEGGSARFFGAGALDGAVNIVLRRPSTTSSLNASLVGGDATFYEGRISANVGIGGVGNTISAQVMHTDGWMHNSDADLQSIMYRAAAEVGEGDLSVTLGANHKVFGANGYYTPRFPDQWEEVFTYLAAANYNTALSDDIDFYARALARVNEDEFRLKRDTPTFYTNRHTTHAYVAQSGVRVSHGSGMTSMLLEGGHDDILSTNLGVHERLRGSIMLERAQVFDNVRISAGIGLIAFSDREPLIAGGVEASVHFMPLPTITDLFYASVQGSGRNPTYTDLYYSDPQTKGDPTLTPEHAITVEAGARRTAETYILNAAVYMRNGKELIDYIVDPVTGSAQAANISEVRILGVDASAALRFTNSVITLLRVGIVYQDVETNTSVTTRYIKDNLRTQGLIETQWLLPLDVQATYLIRILERVTDPTIHVVHDVRIQRTFGVFTPMIELTNISSEQFIETGWVTVPPRWFRAGLTLSL